MDFSEEAVTTGTATLPDAPISVSIFSFRRLHNYNPPCNRKLEQGFACSPAVRHQLKALPYKNASISGRGVREALSQLIFSGPHAQDSRVMCLLSFLAYLQQSRFGDSDIFVVAAVQSTAEEVLQIFIGKQVTVSDPFFFLTRRCRSARKAGLPPFRSTKCKAPPPRFKKTRE